MSAWTFEELARPAALWLFLSLPALAYLLWRARNRAPRLRWALPQVDAPLWARLSIRDLAAALSAALGLTCLILALAAPQRRVPLEASHVGIDILLLIDRSSSMAQIDLDPQSSRWEIARAAAASFIEARNQDRIGLIGFARYPDLVSPSTLDHAALAELLQGMRMVEPGGAEDLTGIGGAVGRAAQILGARDTTSRVLVLLTDGQENVATPAEPGSLQPLEAGALCRNWGVRVYPIALAQEAGEQLAALAKQTGGRAYSAASADALNLVFAEINGLERREFVPPGTRRIAHAQAWIWSACLLLAAAWHCARGSRRRLP